MSLRKIVLTALFAAFLIPVLYGELTINYSFVLLPIALALATHKVARAPGLFVACIVIYAFIFCLSFVGSTAMHESVVRRTVSFFLFLTYFSYVFVIIDDVMIRAFKAAVIWVGVVYALATAFSYFSLGGAALSFSAKDAVGDQRFGFIYLLGAWVVYFYRARTPTRALAKYGILGILLTGLLLTFSRGAVVALIGSGMMYVVVNNYRWITRPTLKGVVAALAGVAVAGLLIVILRAVLPTTFDFFSERLFGIERSSSELADASSSAGVRVALIKLIVGFATEHPITGSGYLGVWILPETPEGAKSAHNQYMDILFRTGLLGLTVFASLLVNLLRRLFAEEQALFWGLTGILIFCFFHDLFKESEGAFVLTFLFGILAQSLRKLRVSSEQTRRDQWPSVGPTVTNSLLRGT